MFSDLHLFFLICHCVLHFRATVQTAYLLTDTQLGKKTDKKLTGEMTRHIDRQLNSLADGRGLEGEPMKQGK